MSISPSVSIDTKDRYKIDALLKEFDQIRSEVRTFEVLQVICITVSVLIYATMLTIAIISNQYILVFISPFFAIFFVIIAMAMLAYTTNLGLRSSQIEGKLKTLLGEPTIEWESIVGTFGSVVGNMINRQVARFWVKISLLVVIEGVAPVVFGLAYGFEAFYNRSGILAWFLILFHLIIASMTIYIGYRFYTRQWEKLKLSI
jgi:hypothetical protein